MRIFFVFISINLIYAGILHGGTRRPVSAPSAIVVSADKHATQAGMDVLLNGGNAIDAAVAVSFVLAVTYPQAGNIGGGGFMMIRTEDSNIYALDYREKAPLKP